MPRGGKRPGAGRPKGSKEAGTLAKEMARERLRQRVIEQLDPLVDAQIANAQGLHYLMARHKKSGKFVRLTEALALAIDEGKDTEHEKAEVWTKDPSAEAFRQLMDRALDKPTEQIQADITGAIRLSWADEESGA